MATQCATMNLRSSSKLPDSYSGLGAESIDPEVIQSFAPAPLPSDLSRQIQRMLDVRSTRRGLPTNDGKKVFFSWNVTGRSHVWKWDQRTGFPVQLTGGEDPTSLVGMLPNETFLIVSRDQAGQENPGLYLLSPAGGPLKKIYHKEKIQAHFLTTSPDSNFIYFSANDLSPETRTIYRFEMSSGRTEKIFSQSGSWWIADLRENERLLLAKTLGSSAVEYYEWNLSEKKLSPILGQGKNEDIEMAYGPLDGEFFVLTNMFGNFKRLYSMKQGAFNPLTSDALFDVSGFSLDEDKTKLIYTTNENGFFRIHGFDIRTHKKIEWPKVESDHIWPGSFSQNGRYLTVSIERSDDPATVFVFDFEKREFRPVLLPSAPEVDTDSFAEAQLEHYPARDGTKIPMLVRRPPVCSEPCPVIVSFHGGPEGQSIPGFNTFAQIFVDAGFVFVEPNVRGSDGFGKEWLHADNGPKRIEVITDIEDVSKYIKETWKKSGRSPKVGVTGYSYGGYATLMAMTKFSGAFDAGVALVGMSNLQTFLQNTAPYRRALRIMEYGDPEKDAEALKILSPITYLEQTTAPLLIIQGVSDPRVPVGEALQMIEALRGRGKAAELILFANEGHGSSSRENRVLEIGHTLRFFKEHLTQ